MSLEVGAEPASVVITQMPLPPAIPSFLRFKERKRDSHDEHGFKEDRILGSQDDSVNTSSGCDIQVRVEQSVVVLDTKLEGGESLERDIYTSENSIWGRGYTV